MSTRSLRRVSPRFALSLALIALAAACEPGPTDPEVSETEIWRLELEQVDDGSEGSFGLRRRGTINLRLRLNHTTTPDPSCAGRAEPDATTFLASVEALPSRLQPPTTGTASGTWNCFGFSAEVRLNDGTTYQLTSGSMSIDYHRLREIVAGVPINLMLPHRWSAGQRRGHFILAPDSLFTYRPFDTHLEVHIENRQGRSQVVGPVTIDRRERWHHRDLSYDLIERPSGVAGSGALALAGDVSARGTRRFSWPVEPYYRWSQDEPEPVAYEIWLNDRYVWFDRDTPRIYCILGATRVDEVQLIIQENGDLECGYGWVEGLILEVRPRWLFLRPGSTDTLTIVSAVGGSLSASASSPTVNATVLSFRQTDFFGPFEGKVAVTVTPDAPRTEHGVVLTVEHPAAGVDRRGVAVEIYELNLTAAPDTVTVARGDAGSSTIRLARAGLIGLDVRLEVSNLPQGVFLVPPSFSPEVAQGDSSALSLRVDAGAAPGSYPLTVCAVIVVDPRETCHSTRVTLRVIEPPARFDLAITTNPSNDVMYVGQNVFFDVLVGSLGGAVAGPITASSRLPTGFTYRSHEASAGSYDPATGLWSIGAVNAGPPTTLRLHARPDSLGTFTHAARLSGGIEGDTNPSNNQDSTTVTVTEPQSGYDLEVQKSVNRDTVAAGDTVVFTLVATNHGPANPVGAVVRDQLPAGLTYASDDAGQAYNPATGIWWLGAVLPAGQSRTLRITVTVSATTTNTATILSESGQDRNGANNTSSVTVTVQ